jgi:hypothetical protein
MESATEKNRQILGRRVGVRPASAEISVESSGKGETVR